MFKLNLGCGADIREGYINVDLWEHDPRIFEWDLNTFPWPWPRESVSEILALDVVEHLHCGLVRFLNEAWRISIPQGKVVIRTPHPDSVNVWIDPTHIRPYPPYSFMYFDPSTDYYQKYGRFYTRYLWHLDHYEVVNGNTEVILFKISHDDTESTF